MNETAQKILGYIKRLPETWDGQPLRQQALDNFDENFYDGSLSVVNEKNFINYCFNWDTTKEEEDYWSKIYYLIMDGTIQLLPEGEEKKEEKKEEFVWTDELVAEFTSWSLIKSPTMQGRYSDIEQFKSSKQRKPLFVTEDEKQIFEGDEYYSVEVFNNSFEVIKLVASLASIKVNEYKDFSTEAAASEYVRLNKPMYSLNDVKKTWLEYVGVFNLEIFIEHLQKLKS